MKFGFVCILSINPSYVFGFVIFFDFNFINIVLQETEVILCQSQLTGYRPFLAMLAVFLQQFHLCFSEVIVFEVNQVVSASASAQPEYNRIRIEPLYNICVRNSLDGMSTVDGKHNKSAISC